MAASCRIAGTCRGNPWPGVPGVRPAGPLLFIPSLLTPVAVVVFSSSARDWLTLTFLPGLGCGLINRLVDAFGSPAAVLAAGGAVRRVRGCGPRLADLLADRDRISRARDRADQTLATLARLGVSLVCRDDFAYPPLLRSIEESPVVLYVRGDPASLAGAGVAVIGSRAATSYGRRCSFTLARDLADRGVTVVSGLAHGIDAAAHQGALDGGGATVGVLGCGIDVVYPRDHDRLYREVAASGAVISEYPPGTRPDGFRFPARNRIIAGLVMGVVVVEATRRSGSLITARLALDQGREVFAVPGRIDSSRSVGPHRLLQQGAHLVQSAEDIVLELGLVASRHEERMPDAGRKSLPVELGEEELRLLSVLEVYPSDIDSIIRATGLAAQRVHGLLLGLEMAGLVRQLPGQRYERLPDD